MMKIVVTSEKPLKQEAVRNALRDNGITQVEIIGVKAESGVGEQPFDDETELGARNRNRNAKARELVPDADAYISMENGQILQPNGTYLDMAALVITMQDGRVFTGFDEGLPITDPALIACVNEARRLKETDEGDITATDVMVQRGLVPPEFSKDPHMFFTGKPRSEYLAEGLDAVVKQAFAMQIKMAAGNRGRSENRYPPKG